MNIQANLEQAIHMLVSEFLLEPYRFYTEADAVARFHQILDSDPVINLKVMSKDGFQVPLIHQEFPTFFRFDDKNPLVDPPIGSKLSRGHYDVVILNPSFVAEHTAETGKNRDIANTRNENIQPIKAVIEFKLDDRGWSNGRRKGAIAELDKLIRSQEHAELRYFVVLMRYTASTDNRWLRHWPEVSKAAEQKSEIKNIFATHRTLTVYSPHIHSTGHWLLKYKVPLEPTTFRFQHEGL